jgi:osmotically-inducible protein OsmY
MATEAALPHSTLESTVQRSDTMDDKTLRQSIIDELDFEPSIDAAHIGIAVENGVVTLTGHVGSYAEKIAAEDAVKRIKGVKAIAQDIEVRYPGAEKRSDDEIAKRALDILAWDVSVPNERIQVKVQKGLLTLSGEVDWYYQKQAAENAVRKLSGVVAVIDQIAIKAAVQPADVKRRIEDALKRNAEVEADNIRVAVSDGKVTLEGKVKAWYERQLVEQAAWAAQGVRAVEDRLYIA